MTNKLLNQMLGYRAGELDGLNVNVLMPPPFSHKHNGYLRTFKANKWGPMIGTQVRAASSPDSSRDLTPDRNPAGAGIQLYQTMT